MYADWSAKASSVLSVFQTLPGMMTPSLPCGQPLLVFEHPFGVEFIPNIQSRPSLVQPEAIFSSSVTFYLGQEVDLHLATISFQGLTEGDKVLPRFLLSRLNTHSSLCHLSQEELQPLHQLSAFIPFLDKKLIQFSWFYAIYYHCVITQVAMCVP